jgi:hypothetical protein
MAGEECTVNAWMESFFTTANEIELIEISRTIWQYVFMFANSRD